MIDLETKLRTIDIRVILEEVVCPFGVGIARGMVIMLAGSR